MSAETKDISERPFPVRSRSPCFYVVLFAIVLPFWSLVPISWFFALYSLYTGGYSSYGLGKLALFFVACCEVNLCFFFRRNTRF